MIKGDWDYLTNLASYNLCGEHKTLVVVAWNGLESCWTLRCGQGHYPESIVRMPFATEEYRQGLFDKDLGPELIKIREEEHMKQETSEPTAITMGGVPTVDLATGELLVPEQVNALVAYARKYALDPYRGHVVLMYSKPYITIDGYLWYANRSKIPYKLSSRPLDEGERKTYQAPIGSHFWVAEVILESEQRSFTGLGVVTEDEITAKSTKHPEQLRSPVVAKHPWQLAQKRAEWQALRRAFPIAWTDTEEEEERKNDNRD